MLCHGLQKTTVFQLDGPTDKMIQISVMKQGTTHLLSGFLGHVLHLTVCLVEVKIGSITHLLPCGIILRSTQIALLKTNWESCPFRAVLLGTHHCEDPGTYVFHF